MNWSDFIDAIWQFALVAGISFVLMCLLASLIRFYQLQNPDLLKPSDEIDDAIRFAAQIASRLGTAYRVPQPFAIMLVTGPDLTQPELRANYLAAIHSGVRQSDVVLALDNLTVGVLVDGRRRDLEQVVVRVQKAAGALCPTRIGAVSCPENGIRTQQLLETARAALPVTDGSWMIAPPTGPQGAASKTSGKDEESEPAEQDAWLDPLTGVLKPERISRMMPKFVARYRREGLPVSLIYFDVDYLARYNDHYGEAAGDAILKGIGKVLSTHVREDDLIGRIAGDGFVVLVNCAPAIALLVAERLATQIKRATFSSGDFTLKTTVSGGVAGYPDQGRTAEVLLDAAHAALRSAQERGRNMCLLFDATMRNFQTLNRGPDEF